jgi:CRP-like cAMP-binding protein
MQIRRELQSITFLSDVLRPSQLDALARDCERRDFRTGEVLMRQGDPSNAMFCLVEGDVSVTHRDNSGRHIEIIRLHAGSVVGDMEVLFGEKRLATVAALNHVRAIEIPRAALTSLVADAPDLAESLKATFARRHAIYSQAVSRKPSPLRQVIRFLRHMLSGPGA